MATETEIRPRASSRARAPDAAPGLTDIVVHGAREHNLQNLTLRLPRQSLIVITGVSGSGKSSLAFDTLYAEGQRRYVESLSAYARQFLGQMEKPDDYLRLMFARLGVQHCVNCGTVLARQSVEEMVDQILAQCAGQRIALLAPIVRGRKGEYRKEMEDAKRQGYLRARVDGAWVELEEPPKLARYKRHDLEIVIDRLTVEERSRNRLADSTEAALKLASGMMTVTRDKGADLVFSQGAACPKCGASLNPVEPRSFSFNSPFGACPTCDGLGTLLKVDPERVVPDPDKSLDEGAVAAWGDAGGTWVGGTLRALAKAYGFALETPWKKLPSKVRALILQGSEGKELRFEFRMKKGSSWVHHGTFEGVLNNLERRYRETGSEGVRRWIASLMNPTPCPACHGQRLKPESLAVEIAGRNIAQWTARSVAAARRDLAVLRFEGGHATIAEPIQKELTSRLGFLDDVGLGYLTLDRTAATLAGGEAQRIRLATQIGSQLTGVLYILDEPSIGLHHRDNRRLLDTLLRLRDLGNTVVVVEHDRDTMDAADWIVDLGPGAGRHGGRLVSEGRPSQVREDPDSLTGQYLAGRRSVPRPASRRRGDGRSLQVLGATAHNLKQVDVSFPLGCFTCVTGVSGSGKSTLVNDILLAALERRLGVIGALPGAHRGLAGAEHVDKVVAIDQSPIGRTPRSNPATYSGTFGFIRDLFANLPESKVRGYGPGRFSFNVKGGRCEHCQGDGLCKIEMHFLPDVFVKCDVCHGRRYNRETLEILYKGRSIADVLEMTVEEGLEFLGAVPPIRRKLETLKGVGLGYIHLGQSATTLSGGEAQRVKLATELSRVATGRTVYILDEPTTGLHFEDVRVLLEVLQALVERGNTVVVIEHNLDVIKCADWIVDLGPDGGEAGGRIVATGTPERVARAAGSYTGQALREML
ncbi:MAG: excinuclease ABC subunit UvrA [Candidatus Eisenbacteria bacterium]|uniref:UvrABC system protein A n=1 Tax=Eiseniibacteriota bacterium TaxID=2212470 RepID=A0A538U929_UNCEI|nr:MAG: excinuclease ABC subunit UvrA [Candidatus Eisenbacteria bacterium]